MQHTFSMLDAVPLVVMLVWVLAILCAVYLAEHVLTTLTVHRHKLDGLADPRVLDFARKRVNEKRASGATR